MTDTNKFPIITEAQNEFFKKEGFYNNNILSPDNKLPYLTIAIMWLEKKYNLVFVTDFIGYRFLTIVKRGNKIVYNTEFESTSDNARSNALSIIINKINSKEL